jgi:transketolase
VATGSEVSLAIEAQIQLENEGIATAVISMPSCELFRSQSQHYQDSVIVPGSKLIVVEAGLRQSWDRILGKNDQFIGMDGFGASAPADSLYKHFKITTEAIIESAKQQTST